MTVESAQKLAMILDRVREADMLSISFLELIRTYDLTQQEGNDLAMLIQVERFRVQSKLKENKR